MAAFTITSIKCDERQIRRFMTVYEPFIKDAVIPSFLGVTAISYSVQLNKTEGYDLIATTNKALNDASMRQLRTLTRGFIGGYDSNRKDFAVYLLRDGKPCGNVVACDTRENAIEESYRLVRNYTMEDEATVRKALTDRGFYERGDVSVNITEFAP